MFDKIALTGTVALIIIYLYARFSVHANIEESKNVSAFLGLILILSIFIDIIWVFVWVWS